jgi:hypothetical protein
MSASLDGGDDQQDESDAYREDDGCDGRNDTYERANRSERPLKAEQRRNEA